MRRTRRSRSETSSTYVGRGYYAGTIFHRVIPGFMIQGGGLDATLARQAGRAAPADHGTNRRTGSANDVGTVAMARTSGPDSATSQFFINVRSNDFLNKGRSQDGVGYAVFGRVVGGMDVVRTDRAGADWNARGHHRTCPTRDDLDRVGRGRAPT